MHNIDLYCGPQQPTWEPTTQLNAMPKVQSISLPGLYSYEGFLVHGAASEHACKDLINQINNQALYAVGVDGYTTNTNIGSHRAMGWSVPLSRQITEVLRQFCPSRLDQKDFVLPIEHPSPHFEFLGSTPWLRCMKYAGGGKHHPHYDAPFVNTHEQYLTLYSWVLFLNTLEGEGGRFQFVNDPQHQQLHPPQWERSDHTAMSEDILQSIEPTAGTLLVFPHWLCHQVENFVSSSHRYIIRGDVAYGY